MFSMLLRSWIVAAMFLCCCFGAQPKHRVVLIVWDAMRPDFVSEQNTPTLYKLSREGVSFAHHHSTYLSATEVNGTCLATGAYPVHDGVIANTEYRPELDLLKPIHTEALETIRKGDVLTKGKYLPMPTLPEIIRKAGGTTVVAGSKPVILLADRSERATMKDGAVIFAGVTMPPSLHDVITNKIGKFPPDQLTRPTRNDWTTRATIDVLWANGLPDFSFVWMNQPDVAQHQTGPGSKTSLEAMRNTDDNLAQILRALESMHVRETTDILLVSDHGCSTVSERADLALDLQKTGFKATREYKSKPARGDVLVVNNSGSSLIYITDHDPAVTKQVVDFLQSWPYTGVIFTKARTQGTFALGDVMLNTPEAADILVSLRWTSEANTNGTPGSVVSDIGYTKGQGAHVSLSPYDMHNTLIAAGPSFKKGLVSTLASGNTDIAPTVLHLLGIKPSKGMDGRILWEALRHSRERIKSFEQEHIEASNGHWRQYLNRTRVNGVQYIDEGNRLD
jgi:predicted AlkP superfamily pyrophosphatase or phosphodiesterase